MARTYLKEVEEQSIFLQDALDHRFNMTFSRAVVTQNRVLAEVGGVPTSFDFSGLTMDAAAYINDYSNRGNYKDHWEDFRLLWGLSASDYEAGLFMEVPGLDAISTITGLQYAYANPGTYTVHVIDSGNESVIDTLSLSANTKANMHADVQDGNTVVTPDKLVEQGVFKGVLYISLDDSWTGTYAIGEQVGNGVWSVVEFDLTVNDIGGVGGDGFGGPIVVTIYDTCVGSSICRSQYWTYDGLEYQYAHIENGVDSVSCKNDPVWQLSVTSNVNVPLGSDPYKYWIEEYGLPCLKDTKMFGNVEHTFLLAEHGAKFYAEDKYQYWIPRRIAKNEVLGRITDPSDGQTFNWADWQFRFNAIAGTYMFRGWPNSIYYEPAEPDQFIGPTLPNQENWFENGQGWVVSNNILGELEETRYNYEGLSTSGDEYGGEYAGKDKMVLNLTGYPIGPKESSRIEFDHDYASNSGYSADHQEFVNGAIYDLSSLFYRSYPVESEHSAPVGTFYIADEIYEEYSLQAKHDGQLSFPLTDPFYEASNPDLLIQDFVGGRITFENDVTSDGVHYIYTTSLITNSDEDYWEGFQDQFFEEGVVGLILDFSTGVGVALFIDKAIELLRKRGLKIAAKKVLKFIPLLGWGFFAYSANQTAGKIADLSTVCNGSLEEGGKPPAYYCGKRDAVWLLVTLGAISEVGANKVVKNALGVGRTPALEGKKKIFSAFDSGEVFYANQIIKISEDYPKVRNEFFEIFDRLGAFSLMKSKYDWDYLSKIAKKADGDNPGTLRTFNGYPDFGQNLLEHKYRVDPLLKDYVQELPLYPLSDKFDTVKMRSSGLLMPASEGTFYTVDQLDDVIDIYFDKKLPAYDGEIIFVMKQDGTLVFAPRRNGPKGTPEYDKLPHPYLSGGEDVLAAGVIKPTDPSNRSIIEVTAKTGHFKVYEEDVGKVKRILKYDYGYNVINY